MKSKLTQNLSGHDKAVIVFTCFSANYLQKFNTIFKTQESIDSCTEIWGEALDPYPSVQIDWALKQLQKYYREWPPNQFEFLRLCAGITDDSIHEMCTKKFVSYYSHEQGCLLALDQLEERAADDPVKLFEHLQPKVARKARGIDSKNVLDFKK